MVLNIVDDLLLKVKLNYEDFQPKRGTFLRSNIVLSGMDVPHLDLYIHENSVFGSAKQIISVFRPNWDLAAIEFKVFNDGITNKLLGCFNTQYSDDVILIRIYGNKTDLLIDRKAETENIKILHSAGLAPKLYGTFDNGLVYEFVPGQVLTPVTCRQEKISELVAKKLADMHSLKLDDCNKEPALWNILKKFLSLVPLQFTLKEKRRRFLELFPEKLKLEKEYLFLKQELWDISSPLVFCHNDLLLGNVVHNLENNMVTFIDYEYTAYNYQAYDIANHFNEYAGVEDVDYSLFPDENYQKRWLRIYLKQYKSNTEGCENIEISENEVDQLFSVVQKFTLASHFLWGIWCLIQAEYSLIDFDFLNYAFIRFSEYYKRKTQIFSH